MNLYNITFENKILKYVCIRVYAVAENLNDVINKSEKIMNEKDEYKYRNLSIKVIELIAEDIIV